MRHPALSRLLKIFGWLVLALLIACGPRFLVPSAMAQGHGHGGGAWPAWHGGGHDGGWHGGVGIGLGWWGWPYYLDWPYYPYAYYPPPVYQAPAVIQQAPATCGCAILILVLLRQSEGLLPLCPILPGRVATGAGRPAGRSARAPR